MQLRCPLAAPQCHRPAAHARRPCRRSGAVAFAAPARGGRQPCILIVPPATSRAPTEVLSTLADRVRAETGCEALVLSPDPTAAVNAAGSLTCGTPLTLRRIPEVGPLAFELAGGATASDAVLIATDPKAGIAQQLGLAPALVIAAIERGPALSAAAADSAAAGVARAAALSGLPAIAVAVATPSVGAPLGGTVEAAARVAGRAIAALRRADGGFPAANFPRAHYPMPTRGRWALGRELPLPSSAAAEGAAAGGLAGRGCWALGDDGSWFGSGRNESSDSGVSREEAMRLLRTAFSEGDLFLLVNVPPTWAPPPPAATATGRKPFASVRPGVLWPCPTVESRGAPGNSSSGGDGVRQQQQQQQQRSWAVDKADLWGRTLPTEGYGSSSSSGTGQQGQQRLREGGFVAQENTASVAERLRNSTSSSTSNAGPSEPAALLASKAAALDGTEFVVGRGTLLSDEVSCGDCDAVMSGCAAVATLSPWPAGHPFALRDSVAVWALEEGPDGLPLWLSV